MSDQQSYPLSWPDGWPRTAPQGRENSRFTHRSTRHSMDESCFFLQAEIDRLRGAKAILSTNVQRRLDGQPYSNRAQPSDPGAAVYFELKAKPISLACDKWLRVEDNIWAIAKHIEALRGQERWGVGSIDQAFRGYTALPAVGESEASTWWKTLGVPVNASQDQVKTAYRVLAKKHHPDFGGDRELFLRLQRAMERFEDSLKRSEVNGEIAVTNERTR
jgi:DnaJ-domain-containing protein 1